MKPFLICLVGFLGIATAASAQVSCTTTYIGDTAYTDCLDLTPRAAPRITQYPSLYVESPRIPYYGDRYDYPTHRRTYLPPVYEMDRQWERMLKSYQGLGTVR